MAVWSDYTWIVVCGCLAAFFTSYGIGANDVANAFGSSVAARTLTMKQALLIATVCEFSGSVLLGEQVTRTVAGGIARLLTFDDEPELYMFGMLCALVSSGTWLLLATYLELPVSTTHSIVGAVMGFALVYGGPSAVVWLEPQSAFPYTSGMVPVVVSWFISPLLSGLAASLLFLLVRTAILRRENSLQLAFWFLPVIVLFTVFINVYFVLYKGGDERLGWTSTKCAWVSAIVAGGCSVLTVVVAMPLVKKYVYEETNLRDSQQLAELEAHVAEARRMMGGNSKSQLNMGSSNMGGSGVNSQGRHSHSVAAHSIGHAAAAGAQPANANANGGPVRLSNQGVSHSTLGGAGGGSGSGMLGNSSGGGGPRALGGSGPLAFNSSFAEHPGRITQVQQQQQQQNSHTSAASLRPSQELQAAGMQQQQQQPRLEHQRSAGAGSSGRSGEPLLSAVAELDPVAGEGAGAQEEGVAGRDAGAGVESRGYGRSTGAASSAGQREQTGLGEEEAQGRAGRGVQGVQQQQQHQGQAPQDAGGAGEPTERPVTGEAAGASFGQGPQAATFGPEQALLQQQQQQQLMQQQLMQQQLQLHAWQPQGHALGLHGQQLPLAPQVQGPGPMWPAVQQQAAWGGQTGGWPSAQMQLQQQQQQLLPQLPQLTHLSGIQTQGANALPLAAAAGNLQAHAQLMQWQHLQLQQLQMLQLQQQQQQLRFAAQPHALSRGQLSPGTAVAGAWGHGASNAATGAAAGTALNASDPALMFARQNAVSSRPGGGGAGPVAESYEGGGGHMGAGSHGYFKGVSGEMSPGAREGDPPRASGAGTAGGGEAGAEADGDVGAYDEEDEGQRTGSEHSGGGAGEGGNVHWQKTFDQLKAIVLHGTNVDVHAAILEDPVAQRLHAQAEVFDPATEHTFKYLQVITAICDSFSHGANDVANAIGPFTAIWYIYRYQRVDYYVGVPIWILVLGGAGIIIGLGTYGYNIMRACGVRLSVITPSRGFCIELSTALVVAVASTYGLPVSTTHCQVGAIAGMGLMEGSAGIHWLLALQFFMGWLFTLILTALLSAALFAAGAYAPSATQGRAIRKYEVAMQELATKLDLIMNRTNTAALSDPATWGNHSAQLEQALATSLAWLRTAQQEGNSRSTRPVQQINADTAVEYFTRTVNTYTNNSLPFIGGMQAKGQILPRQP